MSRKEWKRLEVAERVAAGRMTTEEAARACGLSARQIRRLCRRVAARGARGLEHGNKGRVPANRVGEETRARVVALMEGKYAGFNDRHFAEKLAQVEGVKLGRETVRSILRQAGAKPVRKRRPRKHHRRRERKAQAGQMLLWDGSQHDWLEGRGPVLCLMGAIDDATGDLMPGAHFVEHECAAGYLTVLRAVCEELGVPWSIYMDRHGSLHRNLGDWTLEDELAGDRQPTQVGRALEELEIEAIFALSAQAKGRVERLWGTLQDRLSSELRLSGARTAQEANVVLARYRPEFNQRFAVEAKDAQAAWRPAKGVDLGRVCSFRYETKVLNDNTVRKGRFIVDIPPGPGRRSYARARAELRHGMDGVMRVYVGAELVASQQVSGPMPKAMKSTVSRRPTQTGGFGRTRRTQLTVQQIFAKHRRGSHAALESPPELEDGVS